MIQHNEVTVTEPNKNSICESQSFPTFRRHLYKDILFSVSLPPFIILPTLPRISLSAHPKTTALHKSCTYLFTYLENVTC